MENQLKKAYFGEECSLVSFTQFIIYCAILLHHFENRDLRSLLRQTNLQISVICDASIEGLSHALRVLGCSTRLCSIFAN